MFKTCQSCGKEYWVKPSRAFKSRYCSSVCQGESQRTRNVGAGNPNYKNSGWRTCQYCEQQYFNYNKKRKYCSTVCSKKDKAALNKSPSAIAPLCSCGCGQPVRWDYEKQDWRKVIGHHGAKVKECAKCGKTVNAHKKYCYDCSPTRQWGKPNTICTVCGKSFCARDPKKKLTCSKECSQIRRSEWQKGEKSPKWQGGKTKETVNFRGSYQYGNWRKAVFERDNYICQLCGKNGRNIAAHHIKPFSIYPELALDVTNGVTLCWPCHFPLRGKEAEYEDRFYAITRR